MPAFLPIAEAAPAAQLTDNNVAVGVFLFIGAVNLIGTIVAMYTSLKRNPPIEADLAKIKDEVRAEVADDMAVLRNEINGRFQGLSEKIEARSLSLKADIAKSVEAGESRVAKLADRLHDGFEEIKEKIGEIRGELRS